MDNAEELYDKLRKLSSGEEASYDSLNKGTEIERIVTRFMEEIASPLTHERTIAIGKKSFDGGIRIGHKTILYQISAGNLSAFRYRILLDMLGSTYFPFDTYVLTIAQSFSPNDRKLVYGLFEKVVSHKVRASFIDYDTLISLHRFSSEILKRHADEDLKAIKRLFLESVLNWNLIVSKKSFDKALSKALDRLPFEKQEPTSHEIQIADTYRMTDWRFDTLENKIDVILAEVQKLRSELKQKNLGGAFPSDNEEYHEIDLRKLDGDSSFPCPSCGTIIDPDDDTEEIFQVSETETKNNELFALTLICNNCRTNIRLVGFIDSAGSPDDKIKRERAFPNRRARVRTKKSIETYLRARARSRGR